MYQQTSDNSNQDQRARGNANLTLQRNAFLPMTQRKARLVPCIDPAIQNGDLFDTGGD